MTFATKSRPLSIRGFTNVEFENNGTATMTILSRGEARIYLFDDDLDFIASARKRFKDAGGEGPCIEGSVAK